MKSLFLLPLSFLVLLLTSCGSKKSTENDIALLLPSSLISVGGTNDKITKIIVNVTGPNITPGDSLWEWSRSTECSSYSTCSVPDSVNLTIKSGNDRLFQVFMILENTDQINSTKSIKLYYGDSTINIPNTSSSLELNLTVSLQTTISDSNEFHLSGRYLYNTSPVSYPTGAVDIYWTPPTANAPAIKIEEEYIANGWFSFFGVDGVNLKYVFKTTQQTLFENLNTTALNASLGNSLMKISVPSFYKTTFNELTNTTGTYTVQSNYKSGPSSPQTVYIGFFGPGVPSTANPYGVCYSGMSSYKIKDASIGNYGSPNIRQGLYTSSFTTGTNYSLSQIENAAVYWYPNYVAGGQSHLYRDGGGMENYANSTICYNTNPNIIQFYPYNLEGEGIFSLIGFREHFKLTKSYLSTYGNSYAPYVRPTFSDAFYEKASNKLHLKWTANSSISNPIKILYKKATSSSLYIGLKDRKESNCHYAQLNGFSMATQEKAGYGVLSNILTTDLPSLSVLLCPEDLANSSTLLPRGELVDLSLVRNMAIVEDFSLEIRKASNNDLVQTGAMQGECLGASANLTPYFQHKHYSNSYITATISCSQTADCSFYSDVNCSTVISQPATLSLSGTTPYTYYFKSHVSQTDLILSPTTTPIMSIAEDSDTTQILHSITLTPMIPRTLYFSP